jgi:alpha-1,6-mannosyltransferase
VLGTGVLRITVPAPRVPATGGYRVAGPRRVADVLAGLRPDAIEVSDRLTLRGFGRWAGRRSVRSVVVSHERLDRLLGQVMPTGVARRLADVANRRMAADYDAVVCTTRFAAEEFYRLGTPNLVRVPLGVDLDVFHPRHRDLALHDRMGGGAASLLLHCGRLSVEKKVERSIDALRVLHEQGRDVHLVVAGDGPRRAGLEHRARGLPVTFVGFVQDRARLAALYSSADVSLAPGPHETFCLAALESLAAGTPVVASRSSALSELITPACGALPSDCDAGFAAAIDAILTEPDPRMRRAARSRAEEFGWAASVDGMVAVLAGHPVR